MRDTDPTPREFARDGVLNPSRVMRARDVSRPTSADIATAEVSAEEKLARYLR